MCELRDGEAVSFGFMIGALECDSGMVVVGCIIWEMVRGSENVAGFYREEASESIVIV